MTTVTQTTATEIDIDKNTSSSIESNEMFKIITIKFINSSYELSELDNSSVQKIKPYNRDPQEEFVNKYLKLYYARQEKEVKKTIRELKNELIQELLYFSDDEEVTTAEKKILEIAKSYSFNILGEVVQSIFVDYNDYPQVLAGICKSLCRYSFEETYPWGQTMLSGLLAHKNDMVKEYAVELIENWDDVRLLPILRNFQASTAWLELYISNAVKFLEEKNVLR